MASENLLEIIIIRIFQKGQITIPAEICKAMKIKKGDRIVFEKQDGIALDKEFKDAKAPTEDAPKKIEIRHAEKRNWLRCRRKN